jgi:hypothetical protein
VVLTICEHIIALEPMDKRLIGTLLRNPYEVRVIFGNTLSVCAIARRRGSVVSSTSAKAWQPREVGPGPTFLH